MYVYVCTHMYIIFMYRYSFCFGFVWNQQNRQIETRHYKEEKETLATVGESLSKDERNAFETPSLERKRRNRKGMEWLEGFWGKCPKSVCWNPISESQWRRAAGRHVNGSTSAFNQCFFFFFFFFMTAVSPPFLWNHHFKSPEAFGTYVLPPYKPLLAWGDLSLTI